MARSSLAGARRPLRGKLGSTVYQVKRIDGKTTQIAKAAEESRVNNNTDAQARYRMCYASICHVLSDLADIIPEFIEDGYTPVRPYDYWSSRALYDVQDNFDEHFEESSPFDYARRGEVAARSGEYQFAFGTLNRGAGMSMTHSHNSQSYYDYVDWSISGAPVGCTVGQWLTNARLDKGQTIYVIAFACVDYEACGRYYFARIKAREDIDRSLLWANVEPEDVLEFSGSMPVEFVQGQNTTLMIRFDPKEATPYRLIRCYGQTLREFYKNRWCVRNSWLTYPVLGSAGIQGNFSPESVYNEYWINEPVPPAPSPYEYIDYVAMTRMKGFNLNYAINFLEESFEFSMAYQMITNSRFAWTAVSGSQAFVYGVSESTTRVKFMLCNPSSWRNNFIWDGGGYDIMHTLQYIVDNGSAQLFYDNTQVQVNINLNNYQYDGTKNLKLCGSNDYPFTGKFMRFKIFKSGSGQIIADMRPCIRKADNVVGIYDEIRDIFYTDASWTAPA